MMNLKRYLHNLSRRLELLSVASDAKTIKSLKYGWLTGILYLAPANEASDINVCPKSTPECRAACLYGAGMSGVFPHIKLARIRKTQWLHADPAAFLSALESDIRLCIDAAEELNLKPAFRLNGTSDLPRLAWRMAAKFPNVQFYDYTKIPHPWKHQRPNYHLTFSHSGNNLQQCLDALRNGVNVATVFDHTLPNTWLSVPVLNGDESDLRFLDPSWRVVGLKAKGAARKMQSGGFIQIGAK